MARDRTSLRLLPIFAACALGAFPPSGSSGEAAAPRVSSLRLYVFDCGVLKRGEPTAYNLTRDQVESTDFSDPCFLVAHPRGTLLWDVGIIPDDQIKPGGVEFSVGRGGNANRARNTLRSQMGEIGYVPKDITYLALSHAHADHTANANEYSGSTWLVQRLERDSMFSDAARRQANFATYSALEHCKTELLDGNHDVFGDGTVMLIATPGHTPGHQSLFLNLTKTGPVVLTGDLYHFAAERTFNKLPNMDNRDQTAASRAKVEQLLTKTGAQLWIQHDIVANAKMKKSPRFYD